MSSYVEKVLVPGETLLFSGHPSLWAHFSRLLLAAFFVCFGIGAALYTNVLPLAAISLFGAIAFIQVYIKYKSTELAVTNKRIIVKLGFIRRHTTEINLSKVESVQVEQSVMGRMLNFGTIIVSAGGGPMAPVPHIHDPLTFRQFFMQATDQRQN